MHQNEDRYATHDGYQVILDVLMWGRSCRQLELISALHTNLDVSCIVSAEMADFVLIGELKGLEGEVRIKGSREFKGM